ncbi:MAG: hypothetical protein ACJ748_14485 [Flavisolibacter sp.]
MKKEILSLALCVAVLSAFSQSDKYINAMKDKVVAIDTTRNADNLKDLSNSFERIGDAEKTQWLPYYYAAIAEVNAAYMITMGKDGMGSVTDPMADRAEQLINKAEALSKDNSEIYVAKKMIATLKMMADPMNRYMQYGPQAQQALDMAKKLNPENPRVYMLEGEDKFFTPEQYGGSKTEAKALFEEALKKYDAFKPATPIDPVWGRHTTEYFLSQIK